LGFGGGLSACGFFFFFFFLGSSLFIIQKGIEMFYQDLNVKCFVDQGMIDLL